jgi:hypothetical protein
MPRKRSSKPIAEHIDAQNPAAPPSEPPAESPTPVPAVTEPPPHESPAVEMPPAPTPPVQTEPHVDHQHHPESPAEVPHTNARIEQALENVPGVVRGSEIEQPAEQQRGKYGPDPRSIETITLGDSNLSPKMRLFINNKYQQMAIQFDNKPDAKHIERLRDEGFRFRDGAWTKQFFTREEKDQLDDQQKSARRARVHLEVERTFHEIANGIRHDMGLAPVQAMGM